MKRYFKDWIMIALWGICVAVFFWQTIFKGNLPVPTDTLIGMYHPWLDSIAKEYPSGIPFKNFLITDPVRQQIPWRKLAVDAFTRGKLPLWNATSFSGTPLIGNLQSGVFYPFNIMFLFLPFATAWSLLIMSQPLLAGVFLYLFLRRKRLDPLPSFFGALCFAFSGFSVAWLTWGTMLSTVLWLPLILLSVDSIRDQSQKQFFWGIVCFVAIISSFFAGHPQLFFYCMIMVILYMASIYRRKDIFYTKYTYICIIVSIILVTLPVVSRFISFYLESSRSMGSLWKAEGFFIPMRHLVQLVAPDFFGNPATLNYWGTWNYGEMVGYISLGGLLFAFVGISSETLFWIIAVIVSLMLAIDWPLSKLPYELGIPLISSLQPTRLIAIVCLSGSIIASYGLSFVVHGLGRKKLTITMTILGIVICGLWIASKYPSFFGILPEQLSVVKRNIILPTLLYAAIAGVSLFFIILRKQLMIIHIIIPVVIIGITIFDLFRFGWKFTPFTPKDFFYPETKIISVLKKQDKPFRIITTDDRLIPPNVFTFYDIESIAGYDPIHSSRYEEYIAAMERGEPNIKPPFGYERIINPKSVTSPLLPLMNVQYVLSLEELNNPNLIKIAQEGATRLYKMGNFVPRAYIAESVIQAFSKEEAIKALYSPSFIAGKMAVVESPITIDKTPLISDETITIRSYTNDRMVLETHATTSRYIVVTNSMDSHWEVFIDGKKSIIYRTNYIYFGFIITKGVHTIDIVYR